MTLLLTKVISGGQTGIDELALQLAKTYGIATGGWMPPNFLTEEGAKPEFESMYTMTALKSGLWAKRTRYNARDADATVIFGDIQSSGTFSTINFLKKFKRPYCVNPTGTELIDFLSSHQVKVLNAAGNKASILSEKYYQLAYDSMSTAFAQVIQSKGNE